VPYEIDFLNVGEGSGDSICLRHGDNQTGYTIHVIDGGHSDTAEKIIAHLTGCYTANPTINHMVLSHADDDHARGLVGVLERFAVGTIWMNRPWRFVDEVIDNFHGNWTRDGLIKHIRDAHPYLVEIENIAAVRGITINDAFQGTQIGVFTVLAPSRARYVSLIPDLDKTPESYAEDKGGIGGLFEKAKEVVKSIAEAWDVETLTNVPPQTSASNETSLVQYAEIDGEKILLTADVGPAGLQEAAAYAYKNGWLSPPKFVQVPHHGSRRNVTPEVLDWWLGPRVENSSTVRGSAFCSVGTNKTEHPRKKVANAFLRRGFPVYCTRPGHIRHHKDMGNRPGWSHIDPLPFHNDVEG